MTCEEALARLDDFVDGELGETEIQEIELHLGACTACARQARELRTLIVRAAGLPRELAPQLDLWPGIAARIRTQPVTDAGVKRPWAWSALTAAAAMIVAVLWRGADHRIPPSPSPEPGSAAHLASLQADRDYERAAVELIAAVEARRDRLTPEARARIDESLLVIAQALAAIRSELAKNPGDPSLNHLLVSVHQRRIEVLRTLARLTA
jgi:anti-sigma factor RsiW